MQKLQNASSLNFILQHSGFLQAWCKYISFLYFSFNITENSMIICILDIECFTWFKDKRVYFPRFQRRFLNNQELHYRRYEYLHSSLSPPTFPYKLRYFPLYTLLLSPINPATFPIHPATFTFKPCYFPLYILLLSPIHTATSPINPATFPYTPCYFPLYTLLLSPIHPPTFPYKPCYFSL